MINRPMFVGVAKLAACIAVCLLAGVIGAVFTSGAVPTWYAGLKRPPITPPAWVFGPVWTTLYVLVGIAVFLVWRKGWGEPGVKLAMVLFAVQLGLNAAWSPAFFGMRSTLAGLVVVLPLWAAIVATVAACSRVSTSAALLLIPYLLWASYAAVLNAWFWALNG